MIDLENVCFAYDGIPVLRYVTLHIEKGKTVVIQGLNGCGKTTLLKLINGLIFPEDGKYYFDGEEVCEAKMKKEPFANSLHQRIGYIFQNSDVQLFCSSVEEEIAFGPRQMGLPENKVKERVNDCLNMLGIEKLRERAPYHLSGGEKKKVAIACILSMNPDVFVFDEPLSGLDRIGKEWLMKFLLKLKKMDKTLIVSTHDDVLAEAIADERIYMNENHEIVRSDES